MNACAHEWEQVWIDPLGAEEFRLVGPFRCRKCRALQQASDAVDPHLQSEGTPSTRDKDSERSESLPVGRLVDPSPPPTDLLDEELEAIRQRLAKRRAPPVGTCQTCGHRQELMPYWQPLASTLAVEQWVCQQCRGQISVTYSIGGDEPSADEDIARLLSRSSRARVDPSPLETEKVNADVETPDVLDWPARRAGGISGAASDALSELRSGVQGLGRVDPSPLAQLEALAEYAHEAWSGWMRHLFAKGQTAPNGEDFQIPRAWALRWQRQMHTPYAELAEIEKESDRDEARKMLAIMALRAALLVPTQPTETKDD